MRRLLSVMALGLCVAAAPCMASAAQPAAADPETRALRLQALHVEAQRLIDSYNAGRDPTHLTAARDRLALWVVEHTELFGDGADASAQRAPVERQLGMVEAELSRVAPALTARPQPAPTPVAPTVAPVVSAGPPPNPVLVAERRKAAKWNGSGITFVALGGGTLLGATMPLLLLRNRALRRANEQRFYVDEQEHIERARRRQVAAMTTLGVGVSLVGIGVAMVAKGTVHAARARRLAWSPQVGRGFAGASATLRF